MRAATGGKVDVAFVKQGYTSDLPEQVAQAQDTRVEVFKLPDGIAWLGRAKLSPETLHAGAAPFLERAHQAVKKSQQISSDNPLSGSRYSQLNPPRLPKCDALWEPERYTPHVRYIIGGHTLMGEAKLVIIAMRDEIVARGVEQLLNRSSKFAIIRAHLHDDQSLYRETLSARPAILITDDTGAPFWRPRIAELFGICPDLRVVLVSENGNSAQLFGRLEACYQTAAEFLSLIETSVAD